MQCMMQDNTFRAHLIKKKCLIKENVFTYSVAIAKASCVDIVTRSEHRLLNFTLPVYLIIPRRRRTPSHHELFCQSVKVKFTLMPYPTQLF